jgi:hypothetical protein
MDKNQNNKQQKTKKRQKCLKPKETLKTRTAYWAGPPHPLLQAGAYRSRNERELGIAIHHPGRRGPAAAHPGVVLGRPSFLSFPFYIFLCFLFLF